MGQKRILFRHLVRKHDYNEKIFSIFIKNPYFPIEKLQKMM